MEDITSSEEMNKILILKTDINFRRERGTGRPTKKERRSMDDYKNKRTIE
jgi:ribosome-associated heat shock protein Hsp15